MHREVDEERRIHKKLEEREGFYRKCERDVSQHQLYDYGN